MNLTNNTGGDMNKPSTEGVDKLDEILDKLFGGGVSWLPSGKSEKWIQVCINEARDGVKELLASQKSDLIATVRSRMPKELTDYEEDVTLDVAEAYNLAVRDMNRILNDIGENK